MSEQTSMSKQELLQDMQAGWERLQAFIASYSDEQLTGPKDAAGWTAKDHLMHLAVWADSMVAVLNGTPRRDAMQIERQDWVTLAETYDVVNSILQQRHKDLSLADVRKELDAKHHALVARTEAMSDEDLHMPYNHYQPGSKSETPIYEYIHGNSSHHYDEHIPWMRTLLEQW
ncbi:MAG TPA: DinB family protein [Anaerolineales bacterium]|nr:DinB family protein [Anaerolineales bacterium]HRQ91309.1 DinB family protein [Anaerolineales bacterium]